jgi:hypothetical protein
VLIAEILIGVALAAASGAGVHRCYHVSRRIEAPARWRSTVRVYRGSKYASPAIWPAVRGVKDIAAPLTSRAVGRYYDTDRQTLLEIGKRINWVDTLPMYRDHRLTITQSNRSQCSCGSTVFINQDGTKICESGWVQIR